MGKTTRPFKHDLNKIPYDYTVEVRNRFKEIDLIDRVPDELWTEVRDIVQETGDQDDPHGKERKKKCEVKWALESITTNKASGGDGIPVFQIQL